MPRFRYRAATAEGEIVRGEADASDKATVIEKLHASSYVPIHVEESAPAPGSASPRLFARQQLSPRSLAAFFRQLATLSKAGLPIDFALRLTIECTESAAERKLLGVVLSGVESGATLADAMSAQKRSFPQLCVGMVRAAEAGAGLDVVLERLADFLARAYALREAYKSALVYPLVVVATCVASLAVLIVFVVPRFRPLLELAGESMPASTRVVLGASEFVEAYWAVLLVAPLALLLATRVFFASEPRRRQLDAFLLRVPILGTLIRNVEVARFCRTLGALIKSDVSLLTALLIAREAARNRFLAEAVDGVVEAVRQGQPLAQALGAAGVFPNIAVRLVKVGEETGRQEDLLLRTAEVLEEDVQRTLERTLAMLGPALTIVLGLIVAGVIGAVLSAILGVYELTA